MATAVLSNVGDPTRRFRTKFPRDRGLLVAGDVVMTGFSAITPIRPLTRAALLINTYANRLTIGTRLDPMFFGATETVAFMDQLIGQLQRAVPGRRHAQAA